MNSEGKQAMFQWSARRSADGTRTRYRPSARISHVLVGVIPWINVIVLTLATVIALGSYVVVPGIPVNVPKGAFRGGLSTDLVVLVVPEGARHGVAGTQDVQVFFQNERYRLSVGEHVQRFRQRLSEVLMQRANKDVQLYVDATVEQANLVKVWDVLRDTGIEHVNIVVKP